MVGLEAGNVVCSLLGASRFFFLRTLNSINFDLYSKAVVIYIYLFWGVRMVVLLGR